jgi:hypothetical protein
MKMELTFSGLRVSDIVDEIENRNPTLTLSRSLVFRIEILHELDVEN